MSETKSHWLLKTFLWMLGLFLVGALCIGGFAYSKYREWIVNEKLFDVSTIGKEKPFVTTKVVDRNGKEIGEIFEERRTIVPLKEVPEILKHAVLAAEDKNFYKHDGIDYLATSKAFIENLFSSRARGASTITQQVVKRYNPVTRTKKHKVQEMFLARQLEKIRTKDEILDLYFNGIYLARQRHGFEAASQYLFGKSIRNVTLHEAALLACLPKAPETYYHPASFKKWKAREAYVLKQMVENGWAKKEDTVAANAEEIALVKHVEKNPASEYLDYIEKDLIAQHGKKELGQLGLTIKTTCDLDLQKTARAALEKGLEEIDKANGLRSRPQASLLLMDVHTREVLAMVGGYNQKRADFNRALYAKRQPGSTFKSIVWASAFDRVWTEGGMHISPSTTFIDEEKTYQIPGSNDWTPRNHGPSTGESVTMRMALARSLNTVSARVTDEIGPETVVAMAKRLGITTELQRPLGHKGELIAPLSIALGTSEVTPLEILNAYAVFADQGRYAEPVFLLSDKNEASKTKQVISPALAYVMTSLLSGVVENGTGVRAKELKRPVAGKTGTTQSSTDAWFVGYSTDYIAIVWVGYDNSKPLGRSLEGSSAALPIWINLMKAVHKGRPSRMFTRPSSGIVDQDGEVYLAGKVPEPQPETDDEKPKPADGSATEVKIEEKPVAVSAPTPSSERKEVAVSDVPKLASPSAPSPAHSVAAADPWAR